MKRIVCVLWLWVVLLAGLTPLRADTSAEEANIARVTASLLGQSHFSAQRDRTEVSRRFMERYLDALDGAKMHLLQSDLDDFSRYEASLEDLTLKLGDTTPAQKIFTRFLQRLEQRVEFVQQTLKTQVFDFNNCETYPLDREKATRPRDILEAQLLWFRHLRYEYLQEKLAKKKPAEIIETLTKRYERTLRTMKKLHADQVFEIYLTSLAHVYDPHSDYMGPRQLEDFNISMSLSLCGIGAVLQSVDGYCKIHELLPGGPAAASKQIKPGDRVVTVAQEGQEPVDVIEMPLQDAVRMIRGAKGTKVTLTFIPADSADSAARKTVTLVRDEIKLENQEAKSRLVECPGENGSSLRLGVIDLPSFYSGSDGQNKKSHTGAAADVARLIERLKQEKIEGIVLDLRRNGGGSLEEAIQLTGLFINTGPVVQTRDAQGKVVVEQDRDPSVLYDGPLVVLTSRLSASASEILAGALQDYGRAVIVGDPSTFGKGTVQSLIPLNPVMQKFGLNGGENPGALKLTIRKFYRPSGSSTQLKGVVSDLVLPSAVSQWKVGEATMPESLPWDEIQPAPFTPVNRVAPYLAALREKSAARVAADTEFCWLREDIERYKEQQANPVVSLNEQQRLKETAEQEARDKARKEARAARKPATETQYEITLKNVEDTKLYPPVIPVAPETDSKEEAPLVADISLEEAKRILADYIKLTRPSASGIAAVPAPQQPF
jgi:carboxyl-terminal processing protease